MGGEIILTRPDQPWGPHSLLHKRYRVCFLGIRRLEPVVDHPPHPAPRLKKEYGYISTHPQSSVSNASCFLLIHAVSSCTCKNFTEVHYNIVGGMFVFFTVLSIFVEQSSFTFEHGHLFPTGKSCSPLLCIYWRKAFCSSSLA